MVATPLLATSLLATPLVLAASLALVRLVLELALDKVEAVSVLAWPELVVVGLEEEVSLLALALVLSPPLGWGLELEFDVVGVGSWLAVGEPLACAELELGVGSGAPESGEQA